jgi:hypothetical protein
MKGIRILGLVLFIAGISQAGSRMNLPSKAPGAKPLAVKADGLALTATGEFFEDRMPMRPVPKTPDDNAGRFRGVIRVNAKNEGRKAVPDLSVAQVVVYYAGTTKEFCRFKPAPVAGTISGPTVGPGEQDTLVYSGAPDKIGALRDSMMVYGKVLVTYGKEKQTAVLTPETRVMITY